MHLQPGAFTDVLQLERASMVPGTRPEVVAELSNQIDAAPVQRLVIEARYYDENGKYLGTGSYTDDGRNDRAGNPVPSYASLSLRIRPTQQLPRKATSASLRVVQFVTE
ncbi:hypothetical protein BKD30_07295 [Tersicoccus phoenicis]|uniref:Uncharacterized protein n=2 Tax=Tersicoccus phoenicis TaxID=554083 RepID=A0A1R1LBD7_9MICC|nr:hypothetical protein BKD30_07295 [Tersicoccus phoenicis]